MAISTTTITQAVDALLKWKNTQSESQNPQLLAQEDLIYLILTLKKIPQKGGARTNPNKIPLPHPLISSLAEICLIIDDRPNSKLNSEMAKKKIKEDGISVTKVIKLSKLKKDYKPFEAKRKLCNSYDMFFADKRVIPLLPKLLGKQFFRKKKLPLPIDLGQRNWKEQIERGCCCGLLFFRTGTCSVIRVAKASMERDEIIENVNAAINGVFEFVPKKLLGVRSLHLKLSDSVALPLYQSLPDIKLRIEGPKQHNDVEEQEELKSNHDVDDEVEEIGNDDGGLDKKKKIEKAKTKVEEQVQVGKNKRGRRVQDSSGSGSADVLKSANKRVKEKKRKGNVVEVEGNHVKKPSRKKERSVSTV